MHSGPLVGLGLPAVELWSGASLRWTLFTLITESIGNDSTSFPMLPASGKVSKL